MLASRKASNQPSRNSLALDDRASQILTPGEQSNRDSMTSGSGSEEEKSEVNENNVDHLREFETSEFPPEPPLDASRTSLNVPDDYQQESDRAESDRAASDSVEEDEMPARLEVVTSSEQLGFLKTHPTLMALIVGLVALLIAVLVEMRFNIIRLA